MAFSQELPTSPTSHLLVPSPNPSTTTTTTTQSRRWSPLSYHGLPKSPTDTYISSSVSSPVSVVTPSIIVSTRGSRGSSGSSSGGLGILHSQPQPQPQPYPAPHPPPPLSLLPSSYYYQPQRRSPSPHHHHRFDTNPNTPITTAYSEPSYTSFISLSAPPSSRRTQLGRIPGRPEGGDDDGGAMVRQAQAQASGLDAAAEASRGTGGFCRRVFGKLGCSAGGGSSRKRSSKKRRQRERDVIKVEPVHWTEQ